MAMKLLSIKYAIFGIFVLGVIVSIILRVSELLHEIDSVTGFYKTGSVVVPVLNAILIILVIIFLLYLLLKNDLNSIAFTSKSIINGVIACLLGIVLCVDAASQFYSFMINSALGSPDMGIFVAAMAEIFAAIFFFILSEQKITGKKLNLAAPALLPVLWGVIILGVSFMRYTSIANISEFLFDVLKMVFVLVFLYFSARAIGRVSNNKESKGTITFGFMAALFCIVSAVPKVIVWIMNPITAVMPNVNDLLYIVFAVYIIDVIAEAFFKTYENEKELDLIDANIKLEEYDEND
jgi:hypothetical protein